MGLAIPLITESESAQTPPPRAVVEISATADRRTPYLVLPPGSVYELPLYTDAFA